MKKNILIIVSFMIVAVTVLYKIDKVYMFKYGDGIYPLTTFYELEEDTVDVLVLGSSRAFENINPAILWENHGIAAYDLCGSVQPMWNTYHYLREALKTQHPKLIILEAFRVVENREYMDESRIIKNNYGLTMSMNKIESLRISTPAEKFREFFLEYVQYHNRYTDLSKRDFKEHLGLQNYEFYKGFGANNTIGIFDKPDVSKVEEETELYSKTEEYYRKVIELAQQNNIPIMVIVAPYPISLEDQKYFNRAESIAREYGVEFLNYNLMYDEINMNFSSDIASDAHLNYEGSKKFTTHLGEIISSNYELVSHKGEAKWSSWQKNAEDDKERNKNYKFTQIEEREKYVENLLSNESITAIISVDSYQGGDYEKIAETLKLFGINTEKYNLSGVWVWSDGRIIYEHTDAEEYLYHMELGSSDLTIRATTAFDENGVEQLNKEIYIDEMSYLKVSRGINIMVYNCFTDSYVDTVGFDINNFDLAVR